MTNILITGIKGFIGAHLANYLSNKPDNYIYGIYRSNVHESTFNALNLQKKDNINLIMGNVNIYPDIEEIIVQYGIDQIYHLAAKVLVKDAAMSPTSTYITNVLGTLNILEAERLISHHIGKQIPTLIISSDKAYGTSTLLPYKEDLPLNGLEVYSSSKSCQDIIARAYANNYNLPITVARPANTYGEFDFHWSRLIPTLAKACLSPDEKDKLLTLNKGSYYHVREYSYVYDTVQALESLIKNIDKTKGEAFNISSNAKYTTKDMVNLFLKLSESNKEIEFKEKERIFKEINEQYLDITKIKEVTGWKPKWSLEAGLLNTIEGYKDWFRNKMLNHCSTGVADLYI